MRKSVAAIGLFALSVVSPLSLQAHETAKSDRCTATIAAAQKRIETGRYVSVLFDVGDNVPTSYADYPANRPYRYTIILEGTAAASVMASSKFIQSIAKSVIDNCSSVSLVNFAVYQTDWFYTFGLLPSGKVADFSSNCVEPGPGKLRWGQQVCL